MIRTAPGVAGPPRRAAGYGCRPRCLLPSEVWQTTVHLPRQVAIHPSHKNLPAHRERSPTHLQSLVRSLSPPAAKSISDILASSKVTTSSLLSKGLLFSGSSMSFLKWFLRWARYLLDVPTFCSVALLRPSGYVCL